MTKMSRIRCQWWGHHFPASQQMLLMLNSTKMLVSNYLERFWKNQGSVSSHCFRIYLWTRDDVLMIKMPALESGQENFHICVYKALCSFLPLQATDLGNWGTVMGEYSSLPKTFWSMSVLVNSLLDTKDRNWLERYFFVCEKTYKEKAK